MNDQFVNGNSRMFLTVSLCFTFLAGADGDSSRGARDLFLGLWIPDLFMKRVKAGLAP